MIKPLHVFVILCATAFGCLMPAAAFCQSAYLVKGKVIDKITGASLQGASVFAQNTTFGEVSDASGNFCLRLPEGGYTIAVTFTGYETETIRINRSLAQDSSFVFQLSANEKPLEEVSVAISNEVADGWEKYGGLFTDNFIGQTKFSKECVIKNPEALRFFYNKKKNRLKVLAKEPLVVDNFALGYTLTFAIDSFINEYNTKTSLFIGYPLFTAMQGTPAQQQAWNDNRLLAYKGSMLHLMRSLYARDLQQQGFELQFIVKNNKQEYPIPLKDVYAALNYSKDDSTGIVEFYPNQPEVAVIYKSKPEDAYLQQDPTIKKDFQLSTLAFTSGETMNIESNGFFYDQEEMVSNGYLGFKKLGDMLPYDYYPE
jgi:CarboxypepD_reg-like domain